MSDVYVNIGDTVHIDDPSLTTTLLPVNPPTVASLLQQSRDAHLRFHNASGAINRDGTPRQSSDKAEQMAALQDALTARDTAEQMDPNHTDPAWAADRSINRGVSSATLMTFYRDFISG